MCIPQPYQKFDDIDPSILARYDLPVVLVPPEVIELDSLSADSGEETQAKKQEWPEFFIRLFSNDVNLYDVSHFVIAYHLFPDLSRYKQSTGVYSAYCPARHTRHLRGQPQRMRSTTA